MKGYAASFSIYTPFDITSFDFGQGATTGLPQTYPLRYVEDRAAVATQSKGKSSRRRPNLVKYAD